MIGLISAGYLFISRQLINHACFIYTLSSRGEALSLFLGRKKIDRNFDSSGAVGNVVKKKNSQPWKRQPRSAEAGNVREEGDAGADGGGLGVRDEGREREDHRQPLADRSPEE